MLDEEEAGNDDAGEKKGQAKGEPAKEGIRGGLETGPHRKGEEQEENGAEQDDCPQESGRRQGEMGQRNDSDGRSGTPDEEQTSHLPDREDVAGDGQTGAPVIVPVSFGKNPEMRHLPEEEEAGEKDAAEIGRIAAAGGPADDRRQGAAEGAGEDGESGPFF